MDTFQSWICECTTIDTACCKCKLSINFMSGSFFIDDEFLEYIKDTIIIENELKNVCEFQSITNNTKCTIRFKNDTDLIEVKKLRDLYLQQFSSPIQPSNTKENESINEKPVDIHNGMYQLKTSRPPCFTCFTIYRTYSFMYITAKYCVNGNPMYRMLKIELASNNEYEGTLADIIFDDGREYDEQSLKILLSTINSGNSSTGGLSLVCRAKAILGFIRFTRYYYLAVATEVKEEGTIMGHIVYSISNYDVIPLYAENRQKNIFTSFITGKSSSDVDNPLIHSCLFNMVDLSKGFFFSYNYCLSYSSQFNILRKARDFPDQEQSMFVWNNYLLSEFRDIVSSQWYVSLIQGVFLQKHCVHYGHHFQLSLIARRSREYAGPRYLKRGINDDGYVANEVEVETLIEDDDGHICSHVQLRGSIPGYWKQDVSMAVPRPPIQIIKNDPLYRTFVQHIQLLLERYSAPIQVIDLVKTKEKHPRETLVYQLLYDSCQFVNKQLPMGMKLSYMHIDFADIAKKSSVKDPLLHDILLHQSKISLDSFDLLNSGTSFFATYISPETRRRINNMNDETIDNSIREKGIESIPKISEAFKISLMNNDHLEQHGVMRSNCIDCLDRTNVAQFFLSFTVVYRMLFTLGIEFSPDVPSASPLQRLLIDMYKELGDIISIHYGGSNAHDKIEITKGNKKRKEIFTTLLRHYNNTFTDKIKQESYNVFLGIYRPHEHKQLMNEIASKGSTDYYLHNRGYLKNSIQIIPKEKWWYSSLLHYDENLKGDITTLIKAPCSLIYCPFCKKKQDHVDILLCPHCGCVLQRFLGPLNPQDYYDLSNHNNNKLNVNCMKEIMNAEELLSLPYLQPNITTPVLMGLNDQGGEEHPKMWINWNSRTFVVSTKKKVNKEKQLEAQDEEEEEMPEDNYEETPEENVERNTESIKYSVSRLALSSEESCIDESDYEKENYIRHSPSRYLQNEDYYSIQDKPNQFCIFPNKYNLNINDLMTYEEYQSFIPSFEKTALQDIHDYHCKDESLYIDYLEESRLEDTIDAVSCSIQQQDMDALYHVKYEDEEYDRDENCCILLENVTCKNDLSVYKKYVGL